jgi:hypothetical protein
VRGELSPETKPLLMLLEAERTPALGTDSLAQLADLLERALPERRLEIFEGDSKLEPHGILYWQPLRIWVREPLGNAELDRAIEAAVDWAVKLRHDEHARSGKTRPVSISLLDWNGGPERRRLVKRGGAATRTMRTPRRRARRPDPGRRLR